MSDAFNAGAWVIGEINDPLSVAHNRLVDNFFRPIEYYREDFDNIRAGDFFDIYMEKPLPDNIVQNDDGYLAGYSANMRSIDLLRSWKNADGTTTALFIGSGGVIVYVLNHIMMVQSAALETSRNNILGNHRNCIQDAIFDEETGSEYYLIPAVLNTDNTQFAIVEIKWDGSSSRYQGTFPNNRRFTPYYRNSTSSYGSRHYHRGANSGTLKKIASDMFLVTHGCTIAMAKVVGSELVVTSFWEMPTHSSYGWQNDLTCPLIMYVNKHKNHVYVTTGNYIRKKEYTVISFFVLSYDTNAMTLAQIYENNVWEANATSDMSAVAFPSKIVETAERTWCIPVVYQNVNSKMPARNILAFFTLDTETLQLSANIRGLPDSFSNYDTLCPVALSNTSVICAYRASETQAYLWYAHRDSPTRLRAIGALTAGDALRLVSIEDMPMYFIGTANNSTSSTTYAGLGTCRYLLKAQAYKLGVVLDKDPEKRTIRVATTGLARVNAYCPIYYSIGTRIGYFGQFRDHQLLELVDN